MDKKEISKKVCEILESVLGIEVSVDADISQQGCERWSSLAHIDIVMSIEEEFNVKFSESELHEITSQKKLIEKITEHLR